METTRSATPSQQFSSDSPPATLPSGRSVRKVDVFASVLLLVLAGMGAGIATYGALFFGFAWGACVADDSMCNNTLVTAGTYVALFGTPLVFIAAGIWTASRLVVGKNSWWVTVVGVLATAATWVVGYLLVNAGTGWNMLL